MDKPDSHAHIIGWGADLRPEDRPAYPKERIPARPIGVHWTEPDQQPVSVEILCSTERDGITPIFGTTVPPQGVSGALRRVAFKFSENDLRHWLLLLFADRTDMVEGILDDLAHGRLPNIFQEMGLAAAWKFDRPRLLRKAGMAVALIAIVWMVARRSRR
jgi:hypothetical protein